MAAAALEAEMSQQDQAHLVPSLLSQAEVEMVSDRLLKRMYQKELAIKDLVNILLHLQCSRNVSEYYVYQVTVRNLIAERHFYSRYPDAELDLTAELLGQLLQCDLLPQELIFEALCCIIFGLRSDEGSNMSRFGRTAWLQFKSRIADFPEIQRLMAERPSAVDRLSVQTDRSSVCVPRKSSDGLCSTPNGSDQSARGSAASSSTDIPSTDIPSSIPSSVSALDDVCRAAGRVCSQNGHDSMPASASNSSTAMPVIVDRFVHVGWWGLPYPCYPYAPLPSPSDALGSAAWEQGADQAASAQSGKAKKNGNGKTTAKGKAKTAARDLQDSLAATSKQQALLRHHIDQLVLLQAQSELMPTTSKATAPPPGMWVFGRASPQAASPGGFDGGVAHPKIVAKTSAQARKTKVQDGQRLGQGKGQGKGQAQGQNQSRSQQQKSLRAKGGRMAILSAEFLDVDIQSLAFELAPEDIEEQEDKSVRSASDSADEEVTSHRPWDPGQTKTTSSD